MLTQAKLKESIHYDPETGVFLKNGKPAGRLDKRGHLRITIEGKWHYASKLAWLYMIGSFPKQKIVNRHANPSNIVWENIIEVSRQCKRVNCKYREYNAKHQTGVYWNEQKQKWKAYIIIHNRNEDLGLFSSYESAVWAREQAEEMYGFPECTKFAQLQLGICN
jgi:hypothetical protein